MNNTQLARELIKLAKSIKNSDCTKSKTAGGGAGINFKSS